MPFLRALRHLLGWALTSFVAATLLFVTSRPALLPWEPLDLRRPIGMLTGSNLVALADDPAECEALLTAAGVRFRALPPRRDGECGYDAGVAWRTGGARRVAYAPAAPPLACPLAAGLALWEWRVVQPAALKHLGARITRIDHYGSYACRRIYGRTSGDWSAHASAAALDVAGFRLADGRRITVAGDWAGGGEEAAFLHGVRDGACRLFGTTLSPDYNAAHRDHLHLDMAARGGWRVCR